MEHKEVIEAVRSHERSIILISKAVEDNNKLTTSILEEIKQSREDTIRHYAKQDAIIEGNDRMASTIERISKRLENVEHKQHSTGCAVFSAFRKEFQAEVIRREKLEAYVAEEVAKGVRQRERMDKEIVALRERSDVHKARIKALEEAQSRSMWLTLTALGSAVFALIKMVVTQ